MGFWERTAMRERSQSWGGCERYNSKMGFGLEGILGLWGGLGSGRRSL